MPEKLHAVLLADVMHSSARSDIRRLLGSSLDAISRRHISSNLIRLPYSVTAGDEFQSIATNLWSIPSMILDLRASLQPLTLRIAVGFGAIADRIQPPVNRLSGQAFQSARMAIEQIKQRPVSEYEIATLFQSPDSQFDQTINLIYGLHDTLALKITKSQWTSINKAMHLPDSTIRETAKRLSVNASTVSRNLKRGYYSQLLETSRVAEAFIKNTFG